MLAFCRVAGCLACRVVPLRCTFRAETLGCILPGILRSARCPRLCATKLLSLQLLRVRGATHVPGVIAAMLLPRAHWIHKLVLCRPEPQLTYAAEARANRLPRHQEPRECPREAVFAVTRQAAIVAHCSDVPSRRYLRQDGRPALSEDKARVLVGARELVFQRGINGKQCRIILVSIDESRMSPWSSSFCAIRPYARYQLNETQCLFLLKKMPDSNVST